MEDSIDPDTALGNFYVRDVGGSARKKRERDGRDNDQDAEEHIVQNDSNDRYRDGDDPERPKPIRPAFDVLVFICAPAEGGCSHALILPR